MPELSPRYDPKEVEERLYAQWEAAGYFRAQPDPKRTPYTIVIPPPNVTGILHMGHALNNTIQDILIRFKRMQGFNALWVPGTDHAGIATQNVVEKQLKTEGKRRQDLGREAFVQRVWAWKEQYGNTIIYQLKRLGASCDWTRTRFTMDAGLSEAVADVFVRLYEQGLIYRGRYIINWCPRCQTALSDEEAPRKETRGKLYYIKYPLHVTREPARRTTEAWITVATTRPETMLGDTAIAVHPKDARYQSLIGQRAILPLVGRELPIIADELVDPEFGTGAVKVTPAHDPVDFELAKRHDLPIINIMTADGHMEHVPAPYDGLDRFECRKRVIEELERQGFLEKIADHQHGVGHCYRCDTVVEPRLSLQWFVRMKPLAEPAIKAVRDGTIRFIPERWTKVYLNWMENIQDWCISRQIWWGHRLPVYYCQACLKQGGVNGEPCTVYGKAGKRADRTPSTVHEPGVLVSKTRPTQCPGCGSTDLKQDEDVLDTWFSSWLWPFSTLGWPKDTPDLRAFYPTSILVTAPEIIFFWVARMIMAGYCCLGERPFSTVYIHGTVRDLTGKKMSKSLGNIIDPLEIIDKHGTDALRYTLVTSTAVGTDVFISEEKFIVGRNFTNKLWNAARFILQNSATASDRTLPPNHARSLFDRWILRRLNRTIADATEALERCDFNQGAETVSRFLWHDFCDWYIEFVKLTLKENPASQQVLGHVFEQALRLLHPVMPFVSEALWQQFRSPESPASIMTAAWPTPDGEKDAEAERFVGLLTTVITAVRSIRAEFKAPPTSGVDVTLVLTREIPSRERTSFEAQLKTLAKVKALRLERTVGNARGSVPFVVDGATGLVHFGDAIDMDKERSRIERELADELRPRLEQIEQRLSDEAFVNAAPRDIVDKEVDKKRSLLQRVETLTAYLDTLS